MALPAEQRAQPDKQHLCQAWSLEALTSTPWAWMLCSSEQQSGGSPDTWSAASSLDMLTAGRQWVQWRQPGIQRHNQHSKRRSCSGCQGCRSFHLLRPGDWQLRRVCGRPRLRRPACQGPCLHIWQVSTSCRPQLAMVDRPDSSREGHCTDTDHREHMHPDQRQQQDGPQLCEPLGRQPC